MNIKIKAAAILLGLSLLFSFSACTKKAAKPSGSAKTSSGVSQSAVSSKTASSASKSSSATASAAAVQQNLVLPVSLGKSLNPLTTNSMNNLVLWPLLYDSLTEPGQDYAPVMDLASSVDNTATTVTAHLRNNVQFTDGTPLTAKDVIYSYELVRRTPTSYFYSHLANIAYEQQKDNYTVVFYLNTPDPLIANLLNVPIIKYGSETSNDQYPKTGINVPPTGSGRYGFSSNSFSGTLSYNKNWYKGVNPNFKTIALLNILNDNNTFPSLKIGEINLMFTDYGNGSLSAAGLSTSSVCLNRMVYMGINSSKAGLSNAKIRSALSLALNRKSIVTNTFSSRAAAAYLPFNPNWSGLTKPTAAQLTANTAQAQTSLSEGGFTVKNASGALTGTSDGTPIALSFSLLVNKDNTAMTTTAKQIVSDLNKIGVIVSVDAQPAATYASKLSARQFDLYLGEINLSDNMDISPLLSDGGSASFGVTQPSATLAAFNGWRAGSQPITAVTSAFTAETPFIPICFKYGTISYTKGLTGVTSPTFYNIFQGMESWHF